MTLNQVASVNGIDLTNKKDISHQCLACINNKIGGDYHEYSATLNEKLYLKIIRHQDIVIIVNMTANNPSSVVEFLKLIRYWV